jgi:exosortase H (IPTLxxWG-CTERM-specific)
VVQDPRVVRRLCHHYGPPEGWCTTVDDPKSHNLDILRRYRSALVFILIMGVGGSMMLTRWMQEGVLQSLTLIVLAASRSTLGALGISASQQGQMLVSRDGLVALDVATECNGAWAHLIFLACVLSYPASWRDKLKGLTAGESLLFLLNVIRVASLFIIAVHAPTIFRATHVYVWQFLIIGLGLALFLLWVDRFVEKPA